MESTIRNTALQTISKHHHCEARSIDRSIIQLSPWWKRSRDQDQLAHKARHRQWRRLLSYRSPPSQWQKSYTIDQDEFKTTSITSSGCNRPPDTGEVATAPLNASIHGGNLESSEAKWRTRRVADIEDDDHGYKHSYKSIERDHQPKHLQWTQWPYPWRRPYRNPKAKSRDDLRVSIVTTSFLLFEWSAPIPVCVYTYSSSILEEAHLQKHLVIPTDTLLVRWISTEEDLSTNEALLLPWTSTRAKCTYGEDTLRCKHIEDEKLSFDWSGLMVATHCAAWSAFTVTDRHNSADRLRRLCRLPWLPWLGWPFRAQRQRSFDTQQAKTIGGAGTNGDSGRKC